MKRFLRGIFPTLAGVLLLIALGAGIYSNILRSPFVFDDLSSIVENPAIRRPDAWRAAWTYSPTRVLPVFSFILNHRFGGYRVVGYHVVNVAVHVAAALILWLFCSLFFSSPGIAPAVRPETRREASPQARRLSAWFAAALFLVHPLQTETVTYIVQRSTAMAAFFSLAALACFLLYRFAPPGGRHACGDAWRRAGWYTAALVSTVAAMLSKENTVILPLVICATDLTAFPGIPPRRRWLSLAPFLLALAVVPALFFGRIAAGGLSLDIADWGRPDASLPCIGPRAYLFTEFRVFLTYLRLFVVPLQQNLDYDYPVFQTFFTAPVVGGFLVLCAFAAAVVVCYRKGYRLIGYAGAWILLTAVVESSFLPLPDVIFEHRVYLPLAGWCMALTAVLVSVTRLRPRTMVPLVVLIVGSYGILAYNRNIFWKNPVTLWDDTVRHSPGKARPRLNRGLAYAQWGALDLAVADYTRVLAMDPAYAPAYNNRGIAFAQRGEYGRALADLDRAILLKPDYGDAYKNRGLVRGMRREYDRALVDFNKALILRPAAGELYHDRAVVFFLSGRFDRAWEDVAHMRRLFYPVNPRFLGDLEKKKRPPGAGGGGRTKRINASWRRV